MKFWCGQVFCWGGYWDILGQFVAAHGDAYSMDFFLMGSDVTYYAAVGDISIFRNPMFMYE